MFAFKTSLLLRWIVTVIKSLLWNLYWNRYLDPWKLITVICRGVSVDELGKLLQEVIVVHASLDFGLCVFAVAALTPIWLAEHAHLEALAVLLLAVWLLAPTPVDVPWVHARYLCALYLAGSCLNFQIFVFFPLFFIFVSQSILGESFCILTGLLCE